MNKQTNPHDVFISFGIKYNLSDNTLALFKHYYELLDQAHCNVTTIRKLSDVMAYHFEDSLELGKAVALSHQTIIDVGSGGGFPGIPLKIMYPSCRMILIEVCAKKRAFLHEVIQSLALEHISIEDKDWRTFLRTTEYPANIVCARASLAPNELLRMFQPSSPYRHASLVYWASSTWEPTKKENRFHPVIYPYCVGNRLRKLVFFHLP